MEKKIEYALMRKDGKELTVAPAGVAAQLLSGWAVVGVAEVDGNGRIIAVTGRVIETPAHIIETPDHFLRVIPKFEELPPPSQEEVVEVEPAAEAEEKAHLAAEAKAKKEAEAEEKAHLAAEAKAKKEAEAEAKKK